MHKNSPRTYRPIRDYALIGDCHGAALVSREGSIDWCCLGRFDADPVFCSILDAQKGGFLVVQPVGEYTVTRAYLSGTNILRTTFHTESGKVAVTDFMPVGRASSAGVHDYVSLNAPFWLVRIVEGLQGSVQLRVGYRPTVAFASRRASLTVTSRGVFAEEGPSLYTDLNLSLLDDLAEATIEAHAGQRQHLVVTARPVQEDTAVERLPQLLAITQAFWEEWSAYCRYRGPYRDAVLRSALVLKLLTYAPTGAIVAAPTTSLPEGIGGVRNWDYRYCWLRDAAFTLYSLAALGYSGEARRFGDYLLQACEHTHPRVQIMYAVDGAGDLEEHTLEHLEGYAGSRPVRVGNAAFTQQQLDVYGEVLDWAFLQQSLGGRFDRAGRAFLKSMVSFVATHWQKPGHGLWEMRGPPRQHVFGKIMCWVAVDRTVRLFGPRREWLDLRDAIFRSVMEHGVDAQTGHLLQAYGQQGTDAALLLAPLFGFPAEPRVFHATIEAVERMLGRGNYLLRYAAEDGLPGKEGAFLICSFWLVDALLTSGRAKDARERFEALLACANDVGLYAEEIDPESGAFLGNFPQAFTHLALINCATNLALLEKRGPASLHGTHADRARHAVEATSGLRALWASFKKTGRVGRIWSSRASIMP